MTIKWYQLITADSNTAAKVREHILAHQYNVSSGGKDFGVRREDIVIWTSQKTYVRVNDKGFENFKNWSKEHAPKHSMSEIKKDADVPDEGNTFYTYCNWRMNIDLKSIHERNCTRCSYDRKNDKKRQGDMHDSVSDRNRLEQFEINQNQDKRNLSKYQVRQKTYEERDQADITSLITATSMASSTGSGTLNLEDGTATLTPSETGAKILLKGTEHHFDLNGDYPKETWIHVREISLEAYNTAVAKIADIEEQENLANQYAEQKKILQAEYETKLKELEKKHGYN